MPKKADMFIQLPIEVRYKGKAIPLETGDHFRKLREWIDECIRICDIADALPDLSEELTDHTSKNSRNTRPPLRPEKGKATYNYLLNAVTENGGGVDSLTAARHMVEHGWTTDSSDDNKKKMNVESTARKYPNIFHVTRGYIELVDKPQHIGATDTLRNLLHDAVETTTS